MRPMAQPQPFRFVIADEKARSEYWTVFTNKNDFYLTTNAHKQALKVSLHGSGVCQVALLEGFFAKEIEWRKERPTDRTILRWKRLPTPQLKGQVAASILFASYEFWPEQEEVPASKPHTRLPPPPDMHGRSVHVIYSRTDPARVAKLGGWSDELLYSTRLPNGDYVALHTEVTPLPSDFFAYSAVGGPYVLTLGIDEEEVDDARGISALECLHQREGHCDILSMHNMHLKKMTRPE